MCRFCLALLAATLVFAAGCDTADVEVTGDPVAPLQITEDAAGAVANAVGVAPGGLLNEIADALVALGPNTRSDERAPCERDRTWSAEIERWIRTIECQRGDPAGEFYARFSRIHHFGFFDAAGGAHQRPAVATKMTVDLVDGAGVRRTPRMHHVLLDIGAAFEIDGIHAERVTVNGSYTRAATDTLRAELRSRTITYELSLHVDDVVGPRRAMNAWTQDPAGIGGLHRRWANSVSGTITGEISGVITMTTPEGTRTRDFHRSFSITFGEGGAGNARLSFGGVARSFVIDLLTGTVRA